MDLTLKIIAAIGIIMMMIYIFPAAKHWLEKGPKAQKGDWSAVVLALAAVIAFILLLISLVRA